MNIPRPGWTREPGQPICRIPAYEFGEALRCYTPVLFVFAVAPHRRPTFYAADQLGFYGVEHCETARQSRLERARVHRGGRSRQGTGDAAEHVADDGAADADPSGHGEAEEAG